MQFEKAITVWIAPDPLKRDQNDGIGIAGAWLKPKTAAEVDPFNEWYR